MQAWHSTNRSGRQYQVAHEEGGRLVLDFGKHCGSTLAEVPDSYLEWMVAGGRAFLPGPVRQAAARELAARAVAQELPVVSVGRDELTIDGEDPHTWARSRHAGEVQDLIERMEFCLDTLALTLDGRARRLLERIERRDRD